MPTAEATRSKSTLRGLAAADACDYVRWEQQEIALRAFAAPLLDSPALRRLSAISFLGILSPRFEGRIRSPILERRRLRHVDLGADGSRRNHSLGVALIALRICRHLAMNETQQRYAIAWGLTHDLGNWPLSHTGQYAFSQLLGVDTKTLRNWLIVGDGRAPSKYWVASALTRSEIDPERLLRLLQKTPDKELAPVHTLFRCSLTPDMLDGVWRSGRAFGVPVIDPDRFETAFEPNLMGGASLQPDFTEDAVEFWRRKAIIYRRFFSAKNVALWESAWSTAIFETYKRSGLSLQQSLELDEDDIVATVARRGLPQVDRLHRWKPPMRQRIKRRIGREIDLDCLAGTFIEEPSVIVGAHGSRTTRRPRQS